MLVLPEGEGGSPEQLLGRIPKQSLEDQVGVGGIACEGLSQQNSWALEMPHV